MKGELDYKDLSGKLLEGLAGITIELFDNKIKHNEIKIEDEVGVPLDILRTMWVAEYVSEKTGIDAHTLSKLAD